MYYQRHRLDKNNTSTICRINNSKYLSIQRNCNGVLLYFALCWRDIFRLIILIAFVSQLLRSDIFAGFGICLLIPHLIFVLLFILSNLYEEIHKSDHYVCEWGPCLSILAYIFVSILVTVFPSFSFYSLHWTSQVYDCLHLFFTDCDDCNETEPFKMQLLKYILNNKKSEEIKRRIVVVNYYLTLLFANKINDRYDNSLAKINYFADIHNCNKHGLFNVNWTDIQKAAGSNIHCTKVRWFKTILSLFVVIYDLALLTFLQNTLVSSYTWSVICWIYIAMDCILLFVDAKYFQLYWYCYHIFPFVNETHQIGEFYLNRNGGNMINTENMMDNIAVLYSIMFGSIEKLTLIQNVWENIHPDIVAIIGEYLRFSLPIYQSNEAKNEFLLKFEKIIKSFKDCVNVSIKLM